MASLEEWTDEQIFVSTFLDLFLRFMRGTLLRVRNDLSAYGTV